MGSKGELVRLMSALAEEDLIALSETWLNGNHYSAEFFDVDDLDVYRCDRRDPAKQSGGGVLLTVKKSFESAIINLGALTASFVTIDIVGVEIVCMAGNVRVFVVYIPPRTSSDILSDFLDAWYLGYSNDNKKYLIVGDFNCPKFVLAESAGHGSDTDYINLFMSQLGVSQCNFIVNSLNRLLDLVLSCSGCVVEAARPPLLKESEHHPALSIRMYNAGLGKSKHKIPYNSRSQIKRYNFYRADLNGF